MIPKAHGYPRGHRLRKKAQFTLCYENGKRFYSGRFVIFVCPTEENIRLTGFAISRKIGNAVTRNRLKRLLREFYRLHWNSLPMALIVIVPKRGQCLANCRLKDLEHELMPFIKRFGSSGGHCWKSQCE